MKCLTSVIAVAACGLLLAGCAAKKQWTVPSDLRQGDANAIVARAAEAGALDRLMEAAETTVFDVDEERMAELLRAALATGKLTDTQKATAEWMLHDVCEVNARGSIAADFRFATPEASENRLLDFAPGEPLLMLFYNPDCSHCRQVIGQLRQMENLPRVLAVCIETPAKRWEATRAELPESWVPAFDRSGVLENDIYIIRSMPSIYLLDADRRIELKNPSIKILSERFNSK
ncbi:MAG: hypothetical protein K2L05_05995 [Muribaculaceae bacterium]|nr:hypothetical protein [Muribaculaceae bacterium]